MTGERSLRRVRRRGWRDEGVLGRRPKERRVPAGERLRRPGAKRIFIANSTSAEVTAACGGPETDIYRCYSADVTAGCGGARNGLITEQWCSALSARALLVSRHALDHAAGARIEIVVETDARAVGPGEKAREVAGDQRLTSRAAARADRADPCCGERAVDDAGRPVHRVGR